MIRTQRLLFVALLAAVMVATPRPATAGVAAVQVSSTSAQAANESAAQAHNQAVDAKDQQNVPDEKDEYRLAHLTVLTARLLHISPRAAALLLELLNFAILAGAILGFMRKRLPVFFRNRSQSLHKQLVEARTATEDANHRLRAIEDRLSHLDGEIIGMRQTAEREALRQEESFREVLAVEKDRIVSQAEQEIASAGQAARRDLRLFAADLAVTTAEKRLKMTPKLDQQLIDEFLQGLGEKQ